MMATRIYTVEQLLKLRVSPLVQKPDDLPAIEQWIDESQQQQQQQQQRQSAPSGRQQRPVADASPMGNFSTGQRPSLMQTRSNANRSGGTEDITLGPPKTLFASSRTTSRLSDFADKPSAPLTEAVLNDNEPDGARGSRSFGDKQANRKSLNSGEADGRHNRESWTQARERRALASEDDRAEGGERNGRYSRRDRDKDQDGERRNGFGDRQDTRWGRRDDRRQNDERQGGWRERDKERRERDWDRGGGHAEKEPEWMDDPASKQEDDFSMMSMPRNQEDFEKWKQAQHARNKKPAQELGVSTPEPPIVERDVITANPAAPLKLEGVVDKPLGGWGEPKKAEHAPEGVPTPAKAAPAKGKTSRFMPMFRKDEPREEPLLPENVVQKPANEIGITAAEDKEGFQRILQMLGGTGISQGAAPVEPSSPPPKTASNGARPKSRFTGFFEQTPKSPESNHLPPGPPAFKPMESDMQQQQLGRGFTEEPGNIFGGRLPEVQPTEQPTRAQPPPNIASPEPMVASNGSRDQRPPSGRMNDLFLDQPPSRGAMTPDINIQNLLATQRSQRQGPDKNSEFLLNLLQTKGSSRPPSQQARPDGNFALWLDQPQSAPAPEPHAPKPRAPPLPGLYEEHLMRNIPTEMPRQEQPPSSMQSHDMTQRRTSQRAPPGFFDEQNLFLQQQQQQQHHHRNFAEPPQQHAPPPGRRMSGHPNHPQMQVPQQPPPPFPPQSDFIQSPGGHQQAPPPGFNPHMPRHPPGFHNIPNIFQAPQPPQQQQPQREPLVYGGMGGMASPNAPPGFFGGPQGLPPGFMQMRSPTDGITAAAAALRGGGRGFDGFDGTGQRR